MKEAKRVGRGGVKKLWKAGGCRQQFPSKWGRDPESIPRGARNTGLEGWGCPVTTGWFMAGVGSRGGLLGPRRLRQCPRMIGPKRAHWDDPPPNRSPPLPPKSVVSTHVLHLHTFPPFPPHPTDAPFSHHPPYHPCCRGLKDGYTSRCAEGVLCLIIKTLLLKQLLKTLDFDYESRQCSHFKNLPHLSPLLRASASLENSLAQPVADVVVTRGDFLVCRMLWKGGGGSTGDLPTSPCAVGSALAPPAACFSDPFSA
eukprot:252915-Hanusia_phi.AAC.1